MNKVFSKLFLLSFFLLSFGISPPALAGSCTEREHATHRSTKLDEIKKWVDISDEYVLGFGLDEHNELVPFAVYDKTLRSIHDSKLWKALTLASLGIRTRSYVPRNDGSSDESIFHLEKDFWKRKDLVWKHGTHPATSDSSLNRVSFENLDWEQMQNNHPPLKTVLNAHRKVTRLMLDRDEEEETNVKNVSELLRGMEFDRQSDGSYKLVEKEDGERAIEPYKIIDLKNKKASLAKAASWGFARKIVESLIQNVPLGYPLPQASAAFAARDIDYIELLYLVHEGKALHLLEEALQGNRSSPFLIPELKTHLEDSIFYLLRSTTILGPVLRNLFTKRHTRVEKYFKKMEAGRKKAIERLEKEQVEYHPIQYTNFALGIQRDESQNIHQLKVYVLTKRPFAVVDLLHPEKELRKRQLEEAGQYCTYLFCLPVPGVQQVTQIIYHASIFHRIEDKKVWEAGFEAHLHYNPGELKNLLIQFAGLTEDESAEKEKLAGTIIEMKRLNPLDLTPAQIPSFRKSVEKWIQSHDENYRPWEVAPI